MMCHTTSYYAVVPCRVTQDLEDVLAKIKAKEAEQEAHGEDEALHKKLALVDKKAVTANRTHMLSSKAAEGRKSAGPDPYSRKRTVEKNYWSTGTEKAKVESAAAQQQEVKAKKVCSLGPLPGAPFLYCHDPLQALSVACNTLY